jgi:hypothetical protein
MQTFPTNSVGENVFNLINLLTVENSFSWKQCVDIFTDGARSIVGKTRGFVADVKAITSKYTGCYCIIYRQAVAVKKPNAFLAGI